MAVPLLDSPTSAPPHQPRSRWTWVIIPALVVALAGGAFLYWGPIGLGNGPLSVTFRGAEGTAVPSQAPVGTILHMSNAGPAPAVVDSIDVVGGTRYPAPRVLAAAMLTTSSACDVQLLPAHPAAGGRGFSLTGCGRYREPLYGHALQAHGYHGPVAAAEFTAPARGTCWAITKVVVHYHVGGKHYSGTYPFHLAACLGLGNAGVLAAMRAADGNIP